MIKGQTPSKLNKDVQVDENGYIILSPLSSITVTGGSGGGGNALTTYYYIQKDTTSDLVNYKYYGYMDSSDNWVIKRINRTTNLAEFVKGASTPTAYSAAWTGRAGLTYTDYGTTF